MLKSYNICHMASQEIKKILKNEFNVFADYTKEMWQTIYDP